MVNERIVWIDFLKLFAIFLVVLGHVILFMGLKQNEVMHENTLYSFIYSFHMPLFMTISGFFSNKLLIYEGNIKRKFLQLIVPCISLAILCVIFDIHSLNFWYLKSLFFCYVIYDCVFFLFKRRIIIGILLLIILSFIFFPLLASIPYISSYKIDFMLPFFGLGLLIYRWQANLNNYVALLAFIAILLFIVCFFSFWNSSFIWYFSKPNWIDYKMLFLEKMFVIDFQTFWYSIWRYLFGLLGTCSFFFLCWFISKNKNSNKLFSIGNLGRYSLHIYILQSFIVEVNPFHISFPINNMCLYYIYSFVFSLTIVIICIFFAKILEKNKYIAFFLFGKQLN